MWSITSFLAWIKECLTGFTFFSIRRMRYHFLLLMLLDIVSVLTVWYLTKITSNIMQPHTSMTSVVEWRCWAMHNQFKKFLSLWMFWQKQWLRIFFDGPDSLTLILRKCIYYIPGSETDKNSSTNMSKYSKSFFPCT